MTSSAPKPEPAPTASPAPAKSTIARAEKLVAAWRRCYRILKPIEARVDAARKAVVQLLLDAELKGIATKHGEINLQTTKTTNWEALARSVIKSEFIEQLVPQFTSESQPYARALPKWSAE